MKNVAVVVVTFNRKHLLTECLDAIREQTHPLARVYVIDNCSTDGTIDLLAARGFLDDPLVELVRLDTNLGGAGGFSEGLRVASKGAHDWIWIMDDDAAPEPDALTKLSAYFDDPGIAMVTPIVVDADGGLDAGLSHRRFRTPSESSPLAIGVPISAEQVRKGTPFDIHYCSFVGPCLASWAVAKAGLPLTKLFIHHDDLEYSERLAKVGRLVLVPASRIIHKEVRRTPSPSGQNAIQERPALAAQWIRYFGHRNIIWLTTRGRVKSAPLPHILQHLRIIAGVIRHDDDKLRRLRFWTSALLDGLFGNFDNAKPAKLARGSAPKMRSQP